MSKTRRHFTAEQKAQIVRRHLSGKEPVSKLAEEFDVQPRPGTIGGLGEKRWVSSTQLRTVSG